MHYTVNKIVYGRDINLRVENINAHIELLLLYIIKQYCACLKKNNIRINLQVSFLISVFYVLNIPDRTLTVYSPCSFLSQQNHISNHNLAHSVQTIMLISVVRNVPEPQYDKFCQLQNLYQEKQFQCSRPDFSESDIVIE